MSRETNSLTNDELDLTLETLDQWESELDQFAAGIMQRLSNLTGNKVDTSGLIPHKQVDVSVDPNRAVEHDNSEALKLLQSIRELTQ